MMPIQRPRRPQRTKHPDYNFNVFINCPFDDEYKSLFQAMIFAIHSCGFIARCAQEVTAENIRFNRILDIIGESRYGIHDLSRINLEAGELPRNNMPLELGVFIGCRNFGKDYDYQKEYLVLDSIPHRYRQHITDLGGEDPSIHNNEPEEITRRLPHWLVYRAPTNERRYIPSAPILFERLTRFYEEAPELCHLRGWVLDDLLFSEFIELVTDWIKDERQRMADFNRLAEQNE